MVRFKGALDPSVLELALCDLVSRHEIYRTTFRSEETGPVQRIHAPFQVTLPVIALDVVPDSMRAEETRRIISREVDKPFVLSRLPLVRWTLLRLAPDDHQLLHVEHHLLHDGWSWRVFLRDLLELYRSRSEGRDPQLAEPAIQFADYSLWQRRWLKGEEARRQLEYWSQRLRECPSELPLPYDRPRPATQTYLGEAPRFPVPSDLMSQLAALGRSHGATLFMTMLAAFFALMQRLSGQTDICIGTGIANRRRRETEDLLGMLVNNLALRLDLAGDPAFTTLLDRVREASLESYSNQDAPFDQVVGTVQPTRDPGRNPLFQVMFAFHDASASGADSARSAGGAAGGDQQLDGEVRPHRDHDSGHRAQR